MVSEFGHNMTFIIVKYGAKNDELLINPNCLCPVVLSYLKSTCCPHLLLQPQQFQLQQSGVNATTGTLGGIHYFTATRPGTSTTGTGTTGEGSVNRHGVMASSKTSMPASTSLFTSHPNPNPITIAPTNTTTIVPTTNTTTTTTTGHNNNTSSPASTSTPPWFDWTVDLSTESGEVLDLASKARMGDVARKWVDARGVYLLVRVVVVATTTNATAVGNLAASTMGAEVGGSTGVSWTSDGMVGGVDDSSAFGGAGAGAGGVNTQGSITTQGNTVVGGMVTGAASVGAVTTTVTTYLPLCEAGEKIKYYSSKNQKARGGGGGGGGGGKQSMSGGSGGNRGGMDEFSYNSSVGGGTEGGGTLKKRTSVAGNMADGVKEGGRGGGANSARSMLPPMPDNVASEASGSEMGSRARVAGRAKKHAT